MAGRTREQRYGVAAFYTKPGGEKIRIPKTTLREDGTYWYRASKNVSPVQLRPTKARDVYQHVTMDLERMRPEEHAVSRTLTVAKFWDVLYAAAEESGYNPHRLAIHETRWRLNIEPLLGKEILSQVTAPMVRRVYTRMRQEGWVTQGGKQKKYSPGAIAQARTTLNWIWDSANSEEFGRPTTSNPVRDVRMGRPEAEDVAVPEDHIVSDEEFEDLLAHYRKSWQGEIYEPLLIFGRLSGLRLREVLAMTWADIDFEDGTIFVERQLTQHPVKESGVTPYGRKVNANQYGDRPLKGDTLSKRTHVRRIALEDGLREALLAHRKYMISRTRSVMSGSLLFQSRDHDGPLNPHAVGTSIRKARTDLGISRPDGSNVTYHWLRHTYASEQYAAGTPLRILSKHLGHKSTTITENIYVHFKPREEDFEIVRETARRIAAAKEAKIAAAR